MVEVDLDHQCAEVLLTVTHGGGKVVAALAGGGAETEEAPRAAGDGLAEIWAEGEIALDEGVGLFPVGGGQGLAVGVHQVDHVGAGLRADLIQQTVGAVAGALPVGLLQGQA